MKVGMGVSPPLLLADAAMQARARRLGSYLPSILEEQGLSA